MSQSQGIQIDGPMSILLSSDFPPYNVTMGNRRSTLSFLDANLDRTFSDPIIPYEIPGEIKFYLVFGTSRTVYRK